MWKISLTPKRDKRKGLSVQWSSDEKELLTRLWTDAHPFEEIAQAVNELNRGKLRGPRGLCIPKRSARAVAIQCVKLGLISQNAAREWELRYTLSVRHDRQRDRYKVRKAVFKRDGNKCKLCGKSATLEFAHVVSFDETRTNCEKEAVVLCAFHHTSFDHHIDITVRRVFKAMCREYPDYRDSYDIRLLAGGHCQIVKVQ